MDLDTGDGEGGAVRVDDGSPLVDIIGGECWGCNRLFADQVNAEMWCVEPDAVIVPTNSSK
jgi:hypothetical protein